MITLSIFIASHKQSFSSPKLRFQDIKKVYSKVKDISGNFIQKTHIKDMKRTEVYKGSFIVSIPSKMKWHYTEGDDETEVIIKGSDMIIYQKKARQALKQRFDPNLYGQTPVALLAGLGSMEDDFTVEEIDDGIVLRPRKLMGGIVSIELRPSGNEFPIGSLIITDKRSNRIEIRLLDVNINKGTPDSLFEFRPREGVRLQELR